MGTADLDALLEKLSWGWLSQGDAAQVFLRALTFNSWFELKRAIGTRKFLSHRVARVIERHAEAQGLVFGNPRLVRHGGALHQHCSVSVDVRIPQADASLDDEISGTGDAFSEAEAHELATLELLERSSYQLGKRYFEFRSGISFRRGEGPTLVERLVRPPSTSGFALEATPKRAIEKACLEAIERDAYLCHWHTQISPKELHFDEHPLFRLLQRRADQLGLVFRAYLLSAALEKARVVLLVTFDPKFGNGSTSFSSGLGSAWNLEEAFLKAYFELDRFMGLSLSLRPEQKPARTRMSTPIGRYWHYLDPSNFDALSVFVGGGSGRLGREDLTDGPSRPPDLEELLKLLSRDDAGDVVIYPGPVPAEVKGRVFCCWAHAPRLFGLSYDDDHDINDRRLEEFTAGGPFVKNIHPHPLP